MSQLPLSPHSDRPHSFHSQAFPTAVFGQLISFLEPTREIQRRWIQRKGSALIWQHPLGHKCIFLEMFWFLVHFHIEQNTGLTQSRSKGKWTFSQTCALDTFSDHLNLLLWQCLNPSEQSERSGRKRKRAIWTRNLVSAMSSEPSPAGSR